MPGGNSENSTSNGKRVIGLYSSCQSSEINDSQLQKLTHAIFTYIQMNADGSIGFENAKAKERFYYLKSKAKCEETDSIIPSSAEQDSNVKLMISIGGHDNSQHFSSVLADSELRQKFIKSIITFLMDNRLDGVDLFWKWPGENEKFNYTDFLEELRGDMNLLNKNFVISIVAPNAGIDNWENGIDLDGVLHHVNFINVLTMDYYGPWPSHWGNPAGPLSPLYSGVAEKANFNVNYTMQYYKDETSNPSKFNIILPFFARVWRNVQGPLTPETEVFRHVELKNGEAKGICYMSRWTVEHDKWDLSDATWDEKTKTSYVYAQRAKTFLTFETEQSIAAKIDYVKKENFGGIWIWCVDQDDDRNSLLNAVAAHDLPSVGRDDDNNFNG